MAVYSPVDLQAAHLLFTQHWQPCRLLVLAQQSPAAACLFCRSTGTPAACLLPPRTQGPHLIQEHGAGHVAHLLLSIPARPSTAAVLTHMDARDVVGRCNGELGGWAGASHPAGHPGCICSGVHPQTFNHNCGTGREPGIVQPCNRRTARRAPAGRTAHPDAAIKSLAFLTPKSTS